MKVKVFPKAKKERVEKEGELLKVYVNAPAVDGKANSAVIESLAEYFGKKKSQVRIVLGEKSREKVIEYE